MTNKLATQLPLLRKEAGISQGQLADKLNVSRQSVSKWENGTAIPDLDRIIELAEILQVSLDELVRAKRPQPTQSTINKMVDYYLQSNRNDQEWHHQPIANGWEFIARYWWVIIALIATIAAFIGSFQK